MRKLQVAAGVLCDDRQRVLIAERLGDGPFHGLWEFPGGKIGASESAAAALNRELGEEIGVTAREPRSFLKLEHRYPDRHVVIEFFLVSEWGGEPHGLEGQGLKWVAVEELDDADLLPADKPVVEALKQIAAKGGFKA